MAPDSFTFGGVDMYEAYGIRVVHYDVLTPPLRANKTGIPFRDGVYDHGARYYGERTLRMECDSLRGLTRGQMRELAYTLSKKKELRLWDEPDKYYMARLYDGAELERLGRVGVRFPLTFTCDPFAYGPVITKPVQSGNNPMAYGGTAEAPCMIVLKNTGNTPITNIQITAVRRSEG